MPDEGLRGRELQLHLGRKHKWQNEWRKRIWLELLNIQEVSPLSSVSEEVCIDILLKVDSIKGLCECDLQKDVRQTRVPFLPHTQKYQL